MTEWLVAKYIPDLRRGEPRNIGVVLKDGQVVVSRFKGETSPGVIDGRRIRGWTTSLDNYKSWIRFWRHTVSSLGEQDRLDTVIGQPIADANYYLEPSGYVMIDEQLSDTTARNTGDLLEYLYQTLVEEEPFGAGFADLTVKELSEKVLDQVGIRSKVEHGYRLRSQIETGAIDDLVFDYRYRNGAVSLMRRLSLAQEDERAAWDSLHAASWAFRVAKELREADALIALVKVRPDDDVSSAQLAVLRGYAQPIDVGDPNAAHQLSRILQLS